MKSTIVAMLVIAALMSCNQQQASKEPELAVVEKQALPIQGTWKLISGTLIAKGDTTVTDYTKGQDFIKIINNTHFAFMMHDLHKGKDSAAAFSAGGGTYTLADSVYTEHLDFCNDRQWEGNSFPFVVTIVNDTLVQRGVEKIEGLGVDRLNIEKYARVSK
jgi:predicted small secreted protein